MKLNIHLKERGFFDEKKWCCGTEKNTVEKESKKIRPKHCIIGGRRIYCKKPTCQGCKL